MLLGRVPIQLMLIIGLFTAWVFVPSPGSAETAANAFFEATWRRMDAPVAIGAASRTWIWGPEAFTAQGGEQYLEAPGGIRLVQYFDKSRMEINDPSADPSNIWYVTNGLLAKELVTGRMQIGDNAFQDREPAQVHIAGDPGDPDSPTYATFHRHLDDTPLSEGERISATIDRAGTIGCCGPDDSDVSAGPYVPETNNRVASVFWEHLTSDGKIIERGRRTNGPLYPNPFYASGYPITEAYWTRVPVAGVQQWVLVQPFERRVLTYTPDNPEGWQVEMGNVGRHYFEWRYGDAGSPGAAPSWILPAYPKWVPAGQQVAIPDVTAHYDLHVSSADIDSGTIVARETIRIERFNGPRPDRLFLQIVPVHYGYFALDRLTVAGRPVVPQRLQNGMILGVDMPLDTSTPFVIELDFRLDVDPHPNGYNAIILDQGILRLGYWFPIISDNHGYSDILDPTHSRVADFGVTLAVAPDVVIAHSGVETGRETLGDGRIRYHLTATDMRDFALVLARSFSVTTRTTPSGVTLKLYNHPSSEAGVSDETLGYRQEVIFSAASDAIGKLEDLLGPYPYETLSFVDVGPNMPAGVEFPSLIYLNPAYPDLDRLIYHEVAHQWLYAIIGNRTLIDGWIDEGGAELFERGLPSGFTEVPTIPPGGYMYPLDATYTEIGSDTSRQPYYSIYEQGARFYYDVMYTMGPDAFWRAFRAVYERYAFDIVTPAEMLATFQEYSSTDLRPLYDEYFRYPWIWELLGPGW